MKLSIFKVCTDLAKNERTLFQIARVHARVGPTTPPTAFSPEPEVRFTFWTCLNDTPSSGSRARSSRLQSNKQNMRALCLSFRSTNTISKYKGVAYNPGHKEADGSENSRLLHGFPCCQPCTCAVTQKATLPFSSLESRNSWSHNHDVGARSFETHLLLDLHLYGGTHLI
jgi:hypothetical protein